MKLTIFTPDRYYLEETLLFEFLSKSSLGIYIFCINLHNLIIVKDMLKKITKNKDYDKKIICLDLSKYQFCYESGIIISIILNNIKKYFLKGFHFITFEIGTKYLIESLDSTVISIKKDSKGFFYFSFGNALIENKNIIDFSKFLKKKFERITE